MHGSSSQLEVESSSAIWMGLHRRLWALLALLAVENTLAVQIPHPWFNIYLYRGLPIVFGLALVFFGRQAFRTAFAEDLPFQRAPGLVHVVSLTFLLLLGLVILPGIINTPAQSGLHLAVGVWLALFPVLVASLILVFLPWDRVVKLARTLGPAWLYALVVSGLVVFLREKFRLAWGTSSSRIGSFALTAAFDQSQWLLHRFYPVVVQDPETRILGTNRFLVLIGGTCSGIEGLALMSAFTIAWLIYARKELRLGRALLLIPVALGLMWGLNVVRLVALIAIGDAGYPKVASDGFHSEAGWIAFNVVSLGFLLTAQRISWFRQDGGSAALTSAATRPTQGTRPVNLAAVYLAPFLAITAASVITRATSAGFEWLYPLRFFAALAVLWAYRHEYRKMDWRFDYLGPIAGLLVAGIWLGIHAALSRGAGPDTDTALGLAALPISLRVSWIVIRLLGAVTTVPLAEELAFRGFLARRLMAEDPERISYARLNLVAVAGSSVAFGLVHGHMWLAGIVAGIAFACVARVRGRLGEAVAAHAAANLAIAVVALVRHDYSLW